ncbi:DUF5696 domain-containing protein [Paenibacillus kobensis]|uniref:DUF5696 domain-containing protein n=1 Tax=Paenibacillus kobensis TaxID=59841 RepID=UPI000FDC4904|nr:DUF5696 domain-containing protein [Paenibacillus kobensis]
MSMARNALLTVCIIIGIALAGCSTAKPAGQAAEMEQLEAAFKQAAPLKASFNDSRLAGMKGVKENDQLSLFVNDGTGEIAVLHKQTGEIWYSNPEERDTDPLAAGVNKALLSSQLNIEYYNNFGQSTVINTFTDSAAYKQVKAEAIENGVRVNYKFGTAVRSAADLPMMLSAQRFEELSGKLDKTLKRALTIAYTEDKEKSVYVRNDSALKGVQLDRAFKAFDTAGYTEEDLEQDMQELGFTQEAAAPRIFFASIEYTLDADSLVVKVPASGLHYPSEYPIGNVSLLSFFGAGGTKENGSLFVPDGSGALIHFNNGKTKYPAYQQEVYGEDLATKTTEDADLEQAVRLPVFGLIRDSGALLGIIEQGASVASINADVSGKLNSYNYAYPSFIVNNKGSLTLQANAQERTLPRFQEQPMKTDFTVRYAFLSKPDASYQGLARYYQQYLERSNGLPAQQTESGSNDLPFYLQLVGGITKEKRMVGIPYKSLESLTTFKQSEEIIRQMQDREIANIKLKYSGWFNGGMDHKVPSKISVDGEVGGSEGLRNLIRFTQEHGVSLYPDVSILTANTGAGFDEKDDASRTLRGVPAANYPLDLALNRRDRDKSPSYVISPRLVGGYVESTIKGLTKYGTGGISLRDLADQLNSDFRKNNQIDRSESESISVQALSSIREGNLSIMADGGNAYALPYLSDVTNAPLSNSRFKLEDEQIPFYPMVVRGYVEYAGKPYNLSTYTDVQQYILKCLEYGAGVYFEWIHQPNYEVKDTEFSSLYAVNYKQWIDQAAEIYHEVNDVLKNVQNKRITAHEKLGEGVFKTVYENGVFVIVNYTREQITVDGKAIGGESYMTGGVQT